MLRYQILVKVLMFVLFIVYSDNLSSNSFVELMSPPQIVTQNSILFVI